MATRRKWQPWFRWTAAGMLASVALGYVLLSLGLADWRIAPLLILLALLLVYPEVVEKPKTLRGLVWASVLTCLIITVAIGFFWPKSKPAELRLYYGVSELHSRTIRYETPPSPVSRCTSILIDPNNPGLFVLCGIWTRNVGDEALTRNESVSVQIDFKEDIDGQHAPMWQRATDPEPGYRSEFRLFAGEGTLGPNQRWDLPMFHGRPAPPGDLGVLLTIFYGRRRVQAEFTLRPAAASPTR